jgi:UDP-3-O-[3-hydroxymyristoyl] glucosamine N-acyltransferase
MTVTVEQLVEFLGERTLGSRVVAGASVDGPSPVDPGRPGALSFSSHEGEQADDAIAATASSVVLVREGHAAHVPATASAIVVAEPRREFARLVARFFAAPPRRGIHPTSVIDPGARIGADCYVGAGVVIESGVVVGDRCQIHANVTLLERTVVGDDVTIGPGTCVGYAGFGYEREADGTPLLIPHLGGVRIGDRVEIGSNTSIDRGTIDDTVIDDDAKIDNLVHVAHNCRVRRGSFVIATSILCGGVDVGEGAWVAPNASVLEHVRIGAGAQVGLAATVLRDVEPGSIVVGSPAKPLPPRT